MKRRIGFPSPESSSAIIFRVIIAVVLSLFLSNELIGQRDLIRASDPPGQLAFKKLLSDPTLSSYDQPVRVIVPETSQVAYFDGASFSDLVLGQDLLGMVVGPVYRLRISGTIRGKYLEVYPTIEMLDRLYPPAGLANHHPVVVVLTRSDIENAWKGRLVTKVVYVENPDTALPYQLTEKQQSILDIGIGEDPYSTAARLGRPVAIVRMGSWQPANQQNLQSGTPSVKLADSPAIDLIPHQATSAHCGCQVCQSTCGSFAELEEFKCRRAKISRDEYVCDGNDRKFKANGALDGPIHGLDAEDTVAQIETYTGEIKFAPSTRACIYSPRFASVRRTIATNSETIATRLNVVNEKTSPRFAGRSEALSTTLQNLQPQSNRKALRPSGFVDRTRGVMANNVVVLRGTRHFFKPFEDLQLIRFGTYSSAEITRITLGLQSAIAWNSDVSAQITIDSNQPVIVKDVLSAQELLEIETETSSDLRLCKLASRISAKAGDIIDFTIRFDNIGRTPIQTVKIMDNLSPRLELVESSSECSVKAEFNSEPNEFGSETLYWKLDRPLAVGEGGIIRFQCRVR